MHRNFAQTTKMVNNLRSMTDKVDHIASLLDSDRNQAQGPVGPSPNLLPIHFQLQHLEGFRNETLHQAKRSDAAEREVLVRWFQKLDKVGADFETWLWEIAGHVVDLARSGNGGTVVRLLKVVELEGREDEKVCLMSHPSPCTLTGIGRGDATCAKSRGDDRRSVEIQVDASQRPTDQELPTQDARRDHCIR